MFKKMNLPNKLTILRIALIPLFIIALCLPKEWIWPLWTGLGIYLVAAITDFVDGAIARKTNSITKFGKIMDPLADKLLVSAGFVMLTGFGIIPAWITALIIFRDFFVNAFRMFGAEKETDLAASLSGKIKTVFQLIGIPLALLNLAMGVAGVGAFFTTAINMSVFELMVNVAMSVSIFAAVAATVWSFIDYFIRFKKDIDIEN
ncbi:MAG: CDP-diacylglycerol--glycerol-3-phosphate 3-phosphatidyltransferase [Clostridia bacterium]